MNNPISRALHLTNIIAFINNIFTFVTSHFERGRVAKHVVELS